ncbi:hypothetical protein LEM8419_01968 [Neolewinella maritima]|uniref:Phage abortive infection protein n=2 Tax=Neolewinella maritima TaxID=1383882 RepID=A0ABN8F8K8_9BACT|nr:hypothetical protein LEM8419_01968 [Neolewinella maritima]
MLVKGKGINIYKINIWAICGFVLFIGITVFTIQPDSSNLAISIWLPLIISVAAGLVFIFFTKVSILEEKVILSILQGLDRGQDRYTVISKIESAITKTKFLVTNTGRKEIRELGYLNYVYNSCLEIPKRPNMRPYSADFIIDNTENRLRDFNISAVNLEVIEKINYKVIDDCSVYALSNEALKNKLLCYLYSPLSKKIDSIHWVKKIFEDGANYNELRNFDPKNIDDYTKSINDCIKYIKLLCHQFDSAVDREINHVTYETLTIVALGYIWHSSTLIDNMREDHIHLDHTIQNWNEQLNTYRSRFMSEPISRPLQIVKTVFFQKKFYSIEYIAKVLEQFGPDQYYIFYTQLLQYNVINALRESEESFLSVFQNYNKHYNANLAIYSLNIFAQYYHELLKVWYTFYTADKIDESVYEHLANHANPYKNHYISAILYMAQTTGDLGAFQHLLSEGYIIEQVHQKFLQAKFRMEFESSILYPGMVGDLALMTSKNKTHIDTKSFSTYITGSQIKLVYYEKISK